LGLLPTLFECQSASGRWRTSRIPDRWLLEGHLDALWVSRCNLARDNDGTSQKFYCQTIARGQLFQATFSDGLAVHCRMTQPAGGYIIGFGGKTGLVFNWQRRDRAWLYSADVRSAHFPGRQFHRDRIDVRVPTPEQRSRRSAPYASGNVYRRRRSEHSRPNIASILLSDQKGANNAASSLMLVGPVCPAVRP
jgi:hypothetical protein